MFLHTCSHLRQEFLSAGVEEARSIEPEGAHNSRVSLPPSPPDDPDEDVIVVSDALLCEKYGQWSAWSRCNAKCEQTRARVCSKPQECGKAWVKEKRTCSRRGGRECRTLSYKVRHCCQQLLVLWLFDHSQNVFQPLCSHSYIQVSTKAQTMAMVG